eukprot:6272842-Amphidinium_carterae.1
MSSGKCKLHLLRGILETEKERQDVSRQWMRVSPHWTHFHTSLHLLVHSCTCQVSFMYGSKLLAARSCQAMPCATRVDLD